MRRKQFKLPETHPVLNPKQWQHQPVTTGDTTTREAGGWEGEWRLLFSGLEPGPSAPPSQLCCWLYLGQQLRPALLAPLKAKAGSSLRLCLH